MASHTFMCYQSHHNVVPPVFIELPGDGQNGFVTLGWQPVKGKDNSDFQPGYMSIIALSGNPSRTRTTPISNPGT